MSSFSPPSTPPPAQPAPPAGSSPATDQTAAVAGETVAQSGTSVQTHTAGVLPQVGPPDNPFPIEEFQYASGAFRPPAKQQPLAPPPPKPLPKRPKGRWLVMAMILSILGYAGNKFYMTFLAYEAFGTVGGNVSELPAAIPGLVQYVHVREGETIHQGDHLATLNRLEVDSDLDRIGDQMRIAEANLTAEIGRIQIEAKSQGLDAQRAVAEYYEAWSRLQAERAELALTRVNLDRAKELRRKKSLSEEQYQASYYAAEGQRRKVEKLEESLAAWASRKEIATRLAAEGVKRLQPFLTKIETLEDELARARTNLTLSEVRAPYPGRILRRERRVGEYVKEGDPLFSIIEEGTLSLTVYVRQQDIPNYEVGRMVSVSVAPVGTVACRVERHGHELVAAPNQIRRNYRADEKMLPVELVPVDRDLDEQVLRVGSEVRVPRTNEVARFFREWF